MKKESCWTESIYWCQRTEEDIIKKNTLMAKEFEQIMRNIRRAIGTELQNPEGARGRSENVTLDNIQKKTMKQLW